MRTYQTAKMETKRLGDKEELYFELSQTESSIEFLLESIRNHLKAKGENVEDILANKDHMQAINEIEAISRELELYAGKAQLDVYGFINKLLKEL